MIRAFVIGREVDIADTSEKRSCFYLCEGMI